MTKASASVVIGGLARGIAVLLVVAGFALLLWHASWDTRVFVLVSLLAVPQLVMGAFPGVWRRRGARPPDASDDLARRRPVWSLLSDLYLDTELTEANLRAIGAQLAHSGYDADQLEEILYLEVHPVLSANLMNAVGVWAGFDMAWVEACILRRAPHRSGFALVFGKWMVRGAWREMRRHIEAASRSGCVA